MRRRRGLAYWSCASSELPNSLKLYSAIAGMMATCHSRPSRALLPFDAGAPPQEVGSYRAAMPLPKTIGARRQRSVVVRLLLPNPCLSDIWAVTTWTSRDIRRARGLATRRPSRRSSDRLMPSARRDWQRSATKVLTEYSQTWDASALNHT